MRNLSEFQAPVDFLLTDIDDTLTDEGRLHGAAYEALWSLHAAGVKVVPITGRPAGWCEMIARMWPVAGVVGENGGFWFRHHQQKMRRDYFLDPKTIAENRRKLDALAQEIPKKVPGSAIASDQFCRQMDLAIDFCEDVPALPANEVQKIVRLFEEAGAQAKVSSIHVNGWFGTYDKLTMTLRFLESQFGLTADDARKKCAFSGDSPNDEPMFQFFPNSFGVANISDFASSLKHPPRFAADRRGGEGFVQIAKRLLETRSCPF
ncbi:MAG TPA: HAD-IIB family hydrolase [Pseudobdellovibrionaceae bacterium]|nr:HAD-IIB family hydrolase [Pseudobdellovibrionaceae bacterium]